MFDSNVGINGIPNLLNGGTIGNPAYSGPQGPAMSAADINNSMGLTSAAAQNQAALNNNFNNFGVQTDYYSALGAAYGRNTGGFVSNGVAYDANGQPTVFDTGTQPVDYLDLNANGLPGYGLPPPQTSVAPPQQPYSPPATFDQRFDAVSPPATFDQRFGPAPSGVPAGISATDYLNTYGMAGFNERFGAAPAIDPVLQPPSNPLPEIIFTGTQPQQPTQPPTHSPIVDPVMPPYLDTSFQERFNIEQYDPYRFADRFGYWGPNSGTPSQYYTGTQYPNTGPLPPGYSPPYSVDNQNGALPLTWWEDLNKNGLPGYPK